MIGLSSWVGGGGGGGGGGGSGDGGSSFLHLQCRSINGYQLTVT